MSFAIATRRRAVPSEPHPCTLLELVSVLAEITDDEQEVVATALHMLFTSRSVRLIGNFRGARREDLS
jgi:hypothetical protein